MILKIMPQKKLTITIPIERDIDPLFALTLKEYIVHIFHRQNLTLNEKDVQVDMHEHKRKLKR